MGEALSRIVPPPPPGFEFDTAPLGGERQLPPPPPGFILDRDRAETALRLSLKQASETTPQRQAEVLELSRRTGLPPSVVDRNYDTIRRRAQIVDTPYARMLRETPKTAAWLSNPENAAIAQDDHDSLFRFEKLFDVGRSFLAGVPEFVGSVTSGVGDVIDIGAHRIPLIGLKPGEQGPISTVLQESGQAWKDIGRRWIAPPAQRSNMATEIAGGLGQLGAQIAQAIVAPETVLPSFFAQGVDAMTERARLAGTEGTGSADAAAVANGTVMAVLGTLKLDKILDRIPPKIQGAILRNLADVVITFHEQGLLQVLQSTATNLVTKAGIDSKQPIIAPPLELVREFAIGGAVGAIGRSVSRGFAAIGEAAKASKVGQRSPEKLFDFVRSMTDRSVFIDPEKWTTYWQKQGVNPREKAGEVLGGDLTQYDQAVTAGHEIAVPIAAYTAKIAVTPDNALFEKDGRFEPGQATGADHEAMRQQLQELAAAPPDAAPEAPEVQTQLDASADRVRQDIIGQLNHGRGFTDSAAAGYADQMAAFFRVLGARTHQDPYELYRPYRLRIDRPLPELLRVIPKTDQLDLLLNRLRTEGVPAAGREVYGPSLVDFLRTKGGVIDEGGELRALEVDAGRRRGERNLIQAKGLPLDRAREMAAEEGYLPHDSSIAEFLDAVEREVRGQPVYSPARADPRKMEQFAVFEQLADYLKTRDVDIHKATNEDIKGLLNDAAAQQIDARTGQFFEQSPDDNPRGRFRMNSDRTFKIILFSKANLSTFLHESGHMFLEVRGDIVDELRKRPGELTESEKGVIADYEKTLKYLNVESREQIGGDQHETFARSYEAYLREGKAPNPAMRSVFAQFGAWLRRVYDSLLKLHVELTPEIRGVFDRMLATDIEIARAEQDAGVATMLDDAALREKLGMTEKEFEAYKPTLEQARERARERVTGEVLKDVFRQNEEWWDRERQKARDQVAQEIYRRPDYRALAFLQSGKLPDGSSLPEGVAAVKLDKQAIVDQYGESFLKELPKYPYVYAIRDGVHPDVVAEQFGFSSGEEMLRALIDTKHKPMKPLIEALADDRMRATYGDKMLDGELPQMAREAVLNESGKAQEIILRAIHKKMSDVAPFTKAVKAEGRRQLEAERAEREYERRYLEAENKLTMAIEQGRSQAEIDRLQEELDAIETRGVEGRKLLRTLPTLDQVRGWAATEVRKLTIGELRPESYRAAARKHSRAAVDAIANSDFEEGFDRQLQSMMNTELHRAATVALDGADAFRADAKNYFASDEKLRKSRNMDFVLVAREIAARLFFPGREGAVNEAFTRIKEYDLPAWEAIEAALPPGWQAIEDHRKITVDTFQGLQAIAEAAWVKSRRDKQISINGKLLDMESIRTELLNKIGRFDGGWTKFRGEHGDTSWGERFLGANALLRRMEHWAEMIDGGPDGPFRQFIWEAINQPDLLYRDGRLKYLELHDKLIGPIRERLTADRIAAPEIGYTFKGRAELLGFLLHTGNREGATSNYWKLVLGGRGSEYPEWGSLREDGTLDDSRVDAMIRRMQEDGTLTKADYDYAQGVWDLFNELKPGLQRAHRQLTGMYFSEVTATPIESPWGMYAGGYVPAKGDRMLSEKAGQQELRREVGESGNSFALPTAGAGSTKTRVAGARPLELGLGFIPSHIDWALRYTHMEPAVQDVYRLVNHSDFRRSMNDVDPQFMKRALLPWLNRAATQRISEIGLHQGYLDGFWRHVRSSAAMQVLALNVRNALEDFGGLAIAAVKVPKGRLVTAMANVLISPRESFDRVHELSTYMRHAESDRTTELLRDFRDLALNPGPAAKARDAFVQHARIFNKIVQGYVSTVTWMAAYDQGARDGLTPERQIEAADAAVRQTQGGSRPIDVAAYESGAPFARAAMMFGTWFNNVLNLNQTQMGNAWRADKPLAARAARISAVYFWGFMAPAALSQALFNGMRDHWKEDDETDLHAAMSLLFGSQWSLATAMVPGFGSALNAGIGAFVGDNPNDATIRQTPWLGMLQDWLRDAYHVKTTGEFGGKEISDTLKFIGMAGGVPLGAFGNPARFFADVAAGKAQPEGPADVARGVVSGRVPRRD